jgi:L-alanine-DL-glutamate epimerase-like enolase superfamily enzyme
MKIAKVEVIPLSMATDDVPPRRRVYCVIKLTTDDGLVGWGEATDNFGHSMPMAVKAVIEEKIQWALLDQNPLRLEELIYRVRRETYRYGGFRELMAQALSGVEIALWDIRGKALGQPVSELLGAFRDRVPIYASNKVALTEDAAYQYEFCRPYLERGVKHVKVRIGKDFEWDAAFIRQCREVFGPGIRLLVDGKYNYTADSAVRMSRVLAENDIWHFE